MELIILEMLNIISTLPGLIIVKDSHSRYVAISQALANLLGWKSAEEGSGKTDYDIPCKAAESASKFIKLDHKVITTNDKMHTLDIQEYASGWKLLLSERKPLQIERGTGLFCQGMDVTNVQLFRPYFLLHQLDLKYSNNTCRKPATYILNHSQCPLSLTLKQEECLFFLVRGKTIKEIAKILALSPRTIERHIEIIKRKLNCRYKSELIELAINAGFLYYIPNSFQGKLASIT